MKTPRPIRALAKRDLKRYLLNPIGYFVIIVFTTLTAAAAFWQSRFFLNNLADLDQLNRVFPYLVLFFVAALTMDVWAAEKRQGTDELLFTLPAQDGALVLGKFCAITTIYTLSLILSLSNVGVLRWLGRPDAGLMAANYLGYWLLGVALIPIGMLGSLSTSNATIAFINASLLCAIPIVAGSLFRGPGLWRHALQAAGVERHFEDFANGTASLSSLVYFCGVGALGLYLNVVVVGRRYWRHQGVVSAVAWHHLARVASLFVVVAGMVDLAGEVGFRLDLTAEKSHSLSADTRRLLRQIPPGRPVRISAFISSDVPEEYVQEKQRVLDVLREMQAGAAGKLDLQITDTQPYSDAARNARERFGIVPRLVSDKLAAGAEVKPVFLGAAFTAGAAEAVVPFFDHGVAAEYEIARAIGVAVGTKRQRLGVIDTDAKLLGGVDYETGRPRPPWAVVEELKRQYELVEITPVEAIAEPVDALLVVLPHTLPAPELRHVLDAIEHGVPALIIVDPMPVADMRLAPAASMAARQNPFASPTQALIRKNTGDIQAALAELGVAWPPAQIVWDSYRPHLDMAELPKEVVFVGTGSGNAAAFASDHPASSNLQDVALMFPGHLASAGSESTFQPLLQTGSISGLVSYFTVVEPTPEGPALNTDVAHESGGTPLVLAAQVHGSSGAVPVNAIVIADLDFISDQMVTMRAKATAGPQFDNVTFFLNCLDVLTGDRSYIDLRKRRPKYRTLERVEERTRAFLERRTRDEQLASQEADAALERARTGLDASRAALNARQDLDPQTRQVMLRELEDTEKRRFDGLRVNTAQERDSKIQASRETMEAAERRIRSGIRTAAVLIPPIPILALALAAYVKRRRSERRTAVAAGRMRSDLD